MNIGTYIKTKIEEQGRTQIWVATQINMDNKTLNRKLKNNIFTADELIEISRVLNLDLNKMKEEIKNE